MMKKLLWGLLLFLFAIIFSSCTSADEAPVVQEAIAQSINADTNAVSTSVAIDQQGTAIAQEQVLVAQGTQVAVVAQLTATAAPQIAAAGAERRRNKTNAMNSMTYALMVTVIISVPLTGLGIAAAVWRSSKRLAVVKVSPGELAVLGNWVVDGDSGSVRRLDQAQEQLSARTAVQITHAAQPALAQGMGGEWIEGVVTTIGEQDYEGEQEESYAAPVDRQLGEHVG
jgi:hypothetical protein